MLNADPEATRVVWTGGGTEAANLACGGVLRRRPGACAVDASAHAAFLEPCRRWCRVLGTACVEIPVDRAGAMRTDVLDSVLSPETRLAAVCQVNNETGAVQDVERFAAAVRARVPKAVLAVDGMQSLGRLATVGWERGGIDLLAIGGRKMGGPASVGALVCRAGVPLEPLIYGGGQQNGLRGGTVDTVGVLEFAAAADLAVREREPVAARVRALNVLLRDGLATDVVADHVVVSPADASPFILAFSLPGYDGAVLMRLLAAKNVVVSAGSACRAESNGTSHVLRAMGYPETVARGMLRVSFGPDSSPADVFRFTQVLNQVVRDY